MEFTTSSLKCDKPIQLIIMNGNQRVRYFEKCKIVFDAQNHELFIKPCEAGAKNIHANFERDFVHQKNVLCIDEAVTDSNKYFLILPSPEICNLCFYSVKKAKEATNSNITTTENDDFFVTKFLKPLLHYCQYNPSFEDKIEHILLDLFEFYKNKEEYKNENDVAVFDVAVAENCLQSISANEITERKRSLRKRPSMLKENHQKEYCNEAEDNTFNCPEAINNESQPPTKKPILEELIYAPNFKIINYIQNGISKSRLFIFPNANENLCYEYFYELKREIYICCGCKTGKFTSAIIQQDSSGENFIKCKQTEHICTLRTFEPEKFKTDYVIKKPNFDIIEEEKNGIKKTFLLLFTSADKKMFYKFHWDNNLKAYKCMKCCKAKNYIQARVCKDENGVEFVSVRNRKHICSEMEYLESEEKTDSETKAVELTVPEHQHDVRHNVRNSCKIKSQILKRLKTKKKQKQINHPNPLPVSTPPENPFFQIFKRGFQGKVLKKLVISHENNRMQYFEYTWSNRLKYFICHPCKNKFGIHVYAKVLRNENGQKAVKFGKAWHKCDPIKFESSEL